MFDRFERIEQRLSLHDENFNKIFSAIEEKGVPQKQHIFYDGQIFDAYLFVSDIIKSAKTSIKLIDNYVDESTLVLFTKRDIKVNVKIYTKTLSKQLQLDLLKYNVQYPKIEIEAFDLSHDRSWQVWRTRVGLVPLVRCLFSPLRLVGALRISLLKSTPPKTMTVAHAVQVVVVVDNLTNFQMCYNAPLPSFFSLKPFFAKIPHFYM
jgi:hypothetical protein